MDEGEWDDLKGEKIELPPVSIPKDLLNELAEFVQNALAKENKLMTLTTEVLDELYREINDEDAVRATGRFVESDEAVEILRREHRECERGSVAQDIGNRCFELPFFHARRMRVAREMRAFEQQRVELCLNHDVFDICNFANENLRLSVLILLLVEVTRHPILQTLGFSHIQDVARLIEILIHTRLLRENFQDLFYSFGDYLHKVQVTTRLNTPRGVTFATRL